MEFRIADTFTDSLARLTGQEQKAVKTRAFDLQLDPSAPGMKFHRLDKARDPNFWSVRFSWKALGADVRGRSFTLRINYRTSHQIRSQADRLLPLSLADVDGNVENRKGTISVFNGPPPRVEIFDSADDDATGVAAWIEGCLKEGLLPQEIGVFVRSEGELDRARAAVERAGALGIVLADDVQAQAGKISISIMHLAKGLEFRAVAVMACDDEVLPLQERIESISDESDLEEVYNTERHLLYVACTRARDQLLVTGVDPASEFLGDLFDAGRSHPVRRDGPDIQC